MQLRKKQKPLSGHGDALGVGADGGGGVGSLQTVFHACSFLANHWQMCST